MTAENGMSLVLVWNDGLMGNSHDIVAARYLRYLSTDTSTIRATVPDVIEVRTRKEMSGSKLIN